MNPQTKKYVLAFRLNELKAVLERLWLPQSGRKAELQSRIQDYFGEPHNNGYTTNVPETTDPVRILAAGVISYKLASTHGTARAYSV